MNVTKEQLILKLIRQPMLVFGKGVVDIKELISWTFMDADDDKLIEMLLRALGDLPPEELITYIADGNHVFSDLLPNLITRVSPDKVRSINHVKYATGKNPLMVKATPAHNIVAQALKGMSVNMLDVEEATVKRKIFDLDIPTTGSVRFDVMLILMRLGFKLEVKSPYVKEKAYAYPAWTIIDVKDSLYNVVVDTSIMQDHDGRLISVSDDTSATAYDIVKIDEHPNPIHADLLLNLLPPVILSPLEDLVDVTVSPNASAITASMFENEIKAQTATTGVFTIMKKRNVGSDILLKVTGLDGVITWFVPVINTDMAVTRGESSCILCVTYENLEGGWVIFEEAVRSVKIFIPNK